jgi:hypothetical protein
VGAVERRIYGKADDMFLFGLLAAFMALAPLSVPGAVDLPTLQRLVEVTFRGDFRGLRFAPAGWGRAPCACRRQLKLCSFMFGHNAVCPRLSADACCGCIAWRVCSVTVPGQQLVQGEAWQLFVPAGTATTFSYAGRMRNRRIGGRMLRSFWQQGTEQAGTFWKLASRPHGGHVRLLRRCCSIRS